MYTAVCSVRVLPHQQNTGGFFIAVMQKVKQVPWVYKNKSGDKTGTNYGVPLLIIMLAKFDESGLFNGNVALQFQTLRRMLRQKRQRAAILQQLLMLTIQKERVQWERNVKKRKTPIKSSSEINF